MRLRADALVMTEAERAALAALRVVTPADGPMERHSLRVFLIAERLAADSRRIVDREVLLCAALLHDIGLYPAARSGDVYVRDSRRYAEQVLIGLGWSASRLGTCLDAIESHHRLRSQWHRGVEVELLRRADLVDASAALRMFGLQRAWLRGLFRAVPRDGLYRELARRAGGLVLERPGTITGIFGP